MKAQALHLAVSLISLPRQSKSMPFLLVEASLT
jgi:hypothetical protein